MFIHTYTDFPFEEFPTGNHGHESSGNILFFSIRIGLNEPLIDYKLTICNISVQNCVRQSLVNEELASMLYIIILILTLTDIYSNFLIHF